MDPTVLVMVTNRMRKRHKKSHENSGQTDTCFSNPLCLHVEQSLKYVMITSYKCLQKSQALYIEEYVLK